MPSLAFYVNFIVLNSQIKSSLYSRYYTERVPIDGANLRHLAPGQHSYEETSQRWRAVGDTVFDLTDPGIEPQISFHPMSLQPKLTF